MNLNKFKTEGRLEEFPFMISCFEKENSLLILKTRVWKTPAISCFCIV